MPADAYAGHVGNNTPAIRNNPDNRAPADRADFDPTDAAWADQPGAAARAAGWPRAFTAVVRRTRTRR